MRTDRGFSLLELGVALGVMSILLAAVGTTAGAFFRAARADRTGTELDALARVTADTLQRSLVIQPPPGPGLPPTYMMRQGAALVTLDNGAPRCFDLSRLAGSDRRCPPNNEDGALGADWTNFAADPLPANSPLLALLGGQMQGNGFNPWCEPYVACFYPRRAEVLTCVPAEEVNSAGLADTGRCGACSTPSPLTGEPTVCVLASVPAFSQNQVRLSLSHSELLPALPNLLPP